MNGALLADLIIGLASAGLKYQQTALELQRIAQENNGEVPREMIDAKLVELDKHMADWESLKP